MEFTVFIMEFYYNYSPSFTWQNISSGFFFPAPVDMLTSVQNIFPLHLCLANSTSLKSQLKDTTSTKLPTWEKSD